LLRQANLLAFPHRVPSSYWGNNQKSMQVA
jgi:hypothetical protein